MNSPTAAAERMPIPDLDGPSVVFGSIDHMPAYRTLPQEFQHMSGPHCDAVHAWFFSGIERDGDTVVFKPTGEAPVRYAPREGVDANKALRAIKAVLGSFQPKHEHKIAACGYMLDQWFERAELAKGA